MGYSFWLTAMVTLYAPSHRQGICYTSRGALAGMRNSSMGPPHEGSILRYIAQWANALTTKPHLVPISIKDAVVQCQHTINLHYYHFYSDPCVQNGYNHHKNVLSASINKQIVFFKPNGCFSRLICLLGTWNVYLKDHGFNFLNMLTWR